MRMSRFVLLALFLQSVLFVASCNNQNPAEQTTGVLSVAVMDEFVGPVPDVKITINPGSLVQKTGADGTVGFSLTPGDYFVDASVCCLGPGFIEYHRPVTVVQNDTLHVTLNACLQCL